MLTFSLLPLLLACFGGPVHAEIGNTFAPCLQFFFNASPPQGIDGAMYQPICQRFKNQYHFATLYNREHRAPLFSAYTLGKPNGKRPPSTWMYEPQLSHSRASPEMSPFLTPVDQNVKESQAVLEDYKQSNFTKGHLNPSMHQETVENRMATFTLTNIVPQRAGSNSGPWSILEREVLRKFHMFCEGPMYVVSGALPHMNRSLTINNRVSVPEYLWSAYCCPTFNSTLPGSVQEYFPTYAAVGRNDRDSAEDLVPINVKRKSSVRGYDVRQMTLSELEEILNQRLNMSISLFAAQCQV